MLRRMFFLQELISSGHLVISSAPSSLIYSVATSSSMVTNTPTTDSEPFRRRFTEEKCVCVCACVCGYK